MADGGGIVGEPVGEAIEQAGRHVDRAPDVVALVEHEIIHRRKPAPHRAGLTALLQPLPAEGKFAAVTLILGDLV